jgi:DeoR/GlpR family transcriptional regulator of sugar metabolism
LAIADRHGKLIDLIRRGEFSSPLLAEKLGCSEQTVYRDIDFLKEQGYSIRAIRHARGWAYKLLGEPATVQATEEAAHK